LSGLSFAQEPVLMVLGCADGVPAGAASAAGDAGQKTMKRKMALKTWA
jgi:hypothetical protein